MRVLERKTNWFTPWHEYEGRVDLVRPPPRLHAIAEDDEGRVWTLTLVASAHWAPDTLVSPGRESSGPMDVGKIANLTDAVVEVLEPRRARLLARARLAGLYDGFPAPGLLSQVTRDEAGRVRVVVWQLRVTSPGR